MSSATAALRWLDERGRGSCILFGLCGGAANALLTAAAEKEKDLRLALLGAPVLHLGVGVQGAALTREALDDEVQVLGQKLLDPAYLWRLATFQSDYGHLFRLARSRAGVWFRSSRGRSGKAARVPLHPQTNERFLEAWEKYTARGGTTTFIFSEHDRLYGQFREHFAPFVRDGGLPQTTRVLVLEGANHNATDRATEARLLAFLDEIGRRGGAR